MGSRNDYRVSKIIVLCKDCGDDVGLYPGRHKCSSDQRPYLPTLCSSTSDHHWSEEDVPELIASTPASTSVKRQASDSSIESGKWSFFRTNSSSPPVKIAEETNSSYFDSYATHLKTSSSFNDIQEASATSGKRLWGKMKENEKWKELIADKKKESQRTSGKLWERIIHATISNSVDYHESGAESDDEDWEGETHVSRILREYHQSKNAPLPSWLYDDRTPITTIASMPVEAIQRSKTTRTRRLWQQESEESARERERRELRSEPLSRTKSERFNFSSNSNRQLPDQRTSLPFMRNIEQHQQGEEADQLYGSIAPRRTNTTRRYLDKSLNNNNNITRSATISQRNNSYF
ncbi:unnamed protein product [Mucor hiemalis]